MRKALRTLALGLGIGTLVMGSATLAYGAQALTGQWCDEGDAGWWYKLDYEGNQFLANTWYWIEDDDGIIRCYCFDYNGWLITDASKLDEPIDSDGRWLDELGQVVTKSPDEVEYAHSVHFTAPSSSSTTSSTSSGSSSSSSLSTATSATGITGSGSGNATKITSDGDVPIDNGEVPYQVASVSGGIVTNTWAGYTMTLPELVTYSASNDGTDWYIGSSEKELVYSVFYRLDMFSAGNTDVNAFAASVLSSDKVLRGDKAVGTSAVSYNGFDFIKVTKSKETPEGTFYNYAFIRQIPGTNYAQVITFETQDGTDYSYSMDTYTAI